MYPKFDEVYEALLFEQYDLDSARREILKPTWYWTGINVSLLALSIALLTTNVLIAFVIVAFVIWSIVQHARVRKRRDEAYEMHYRTAIVAPTLHTIATQYNSAHVTLTLSYDGEARVFDEVIDASPLRMYEEHMRSGSDFISGTYEGCYFKGSVVTTYKDTVEEAIETNVDPATLVAFEGTLLRVELPQMVTGTHRLIEGTFSANSWKTAFDKQVSLVQYQALKRKDASLRALPVTDVTDTPFQERFKLHTSDEDEALQLFSERVQTDLLALLPMLKRHGMTMQLLIEGNSLYIVLKGNRYIAEERMQLSLDDYQLRTIYTGLVSQLRIVDACKPMMHPSKKTSDV